MIFSVWADWDDATHYLERKTNGICAWGRVCARAAIFKSKAEAEAMAAAVSNPACDVNATIFRNEDAESRLAMA